MHDPNNMKLTLVQVICECFCLHSPAPLSKRILICSLSWYCAYGNVMQTPEPSWLPTDWCIYYRNESNLPLCLIVWGLALLRSVPVPFFALDDNWLIEKIYYHDRLGSLSEMIKAITDAGTEIFSPYFPLKTLDMWNVAKEDFCMCIYTFFFHLKCMGDKL